MSSTDNQISFFKRLQRQILSGKKTATIRDKSESHYVAGQELALVTHEDGRCFGKVQVLSIEAVNFSQLTRTHARAENLPLFALKWVIRRIYPKEQQFYFIQFKLVEQ